MENPELIHALYITSVYSRLMLLLDRERDESFHHPVSAGVSAALLTVTPDNTLSEAPLRGVHFVARSRALPHTSD